MAAEEARLGSPTVLSAYRCPLAPLSCFKYLGEILAALDYDWLAVVHNPRQARKKWAWMMWVLGREGAYDCTLGMLYVVVLLYVSERWFMYPYIGMTLGSFHH